MAGSMNEVLTFTGTVRPDPQNRGAGDPAPYIPSRALVQAVNLALLLEKRPLLIKGEAGAGKSRLAEAVAYELDMPLFVWPIKSTSVARDGLYTFDAVRRLHDAQIGGQDVDAGARAADAGNYVRLGPLGQAFASEQRSVVLIDEIDKADIDFPNDLLIELDEQRFYIQETDEWIHAVHPPLVIITSNDERGLSDAFLRRCLLHYIPFPSEDELLEIVQAHFADAPEALASAAVSRFVALRSEMDAAASDKKVTTAELLDWFALLMNHYDNGAVLDQLQERLLFTEALLKSWRDQRRFGESGG